MATVVESSDIEVVTKDSTNLWDQLREMVTSQRWTTQDHASLSLMQEYDNVCSLFIVRKSDNFLLGAVILIDSEDHVYGNMYIMREGYRGSGYGMNLMNLFVERLAPSLMTKPLLARGAPAMLKKYTKAPFHAIVHYEMWSCEFKDKKDLLTFFPTARHSFRVQRIKDMNARQFREFKEYDKYVTGYDRSKFLEDYYSIAFVEGVVFYDEDNKIQGMAGVVPTTNEGGLYKLNPIYARTKDEACAIVNEVVSLIHDPNAHFVVHCRTQAAGDWILEKCKTEKRELHFVGGLCGATRFNVPYVDKSRVDLIHAPTNSPMYFDG